MLKCRIIQGPLQRCYVIEPTACINAPVLPKAFFVFSGMTCVYCFGEVTCFVCPAIPRWRCRGAEQRALKERGGQVEEFVESGAALLAGIFAASGQVAVRAFEGSGGASESGSREDLAYAEWYLAHGQEWERLYGQVCDGLDGLTGGAKMDGWISASAARLTGILGRALCTLSHRRAYW